MQVQVLGSSWRCRAVQPLLRVHSTTVAYCSIPVHTHTPCHPLTHHPFCALISSPNCSAPTSLPHTYTYGNRVLLSW